MQRIRHTLTPLAIAMILVGCTTGSGAVPVPGASVPVTAPTGTSDTVPPTEPPSDITSTQANPDTSGNQAASTAPIIAAPATDPITTQAEAPATSEAEAPATTAAPPATNAPSDDVYFRVGDEGDEIGLMQFKLSVLGYLPVGSDTGVFDDATSGALRRFQADYGLGVDGVFGPLTGRALTAAAQSVHVEN